MMKFGSSLFMSLSAALLWSGAATAADLKQVGTIAVPGEKLTSFDIGVIDQGTGRYYLSDRSNKAVDVFDTTTESFLGRADGFLGAVMKAGKVDTGISGPDGVTVTGREVWAGDGDSTVKLIDPATMKIVAAISTGGHGRVDEMGYDPKDQVFIGVNNADDPPFATVISTKPDHAIVGKITFPTATDGAEQPTYNPDDGLFYMSIPEFDKDPKKGGVAVIDPRTATLVKVLPVENCHPAGLAFGPNNNFVLGCDADGDDMPAATTIMNATSGAVVAVISGLGGSDMVNYNARNGQYYTASRNNPGGPVLGVIDATTGKLVQAIKISGGTPHSVASSEATGHVFVPVGATGGGDGSIHIFAPAP